MMGDSSVERKFPFWASLAGGLIVLVAALYGFMLLHQRPSLPPRIDPSSIEEIDGLKIERPKDIEFALWKKAIGETAVLRLRRGGKSQPPEVVLLAAYYPDRLLAVYLAIGLACWAIGVLTFFLKSADPQARIFYGMALAFSLSLIVQGDNYCLRSTWTSWIPCLLYIILIGLAPAFLLHFVAAFSPSRSRRRVALLYVLPLTCDVFFLGLFLYGYLTPSLEALRFYDKAYDVFRLYLIGYIMAAVIYLGWLWKHPPNEDKRAQIQWVFMGLFVGTVPFLLFYEIPSFFGLNTGLEDATAVFFVAIPIGLAIAVVKHRLLDIDLVVNRGLVYSLLTASTAGIYLLAILIFERVFSGLFQAHQTAFSVLGVFLAAAAFHPAQKTIQNFVDRAFFRQKYNDRQTVLAFGERSQRIARREDLLGLFVSTLKNVFVLDKAGAFVLEPGLDPLRPDFRRSIRCGEPLDASSFSSSGLVPQTFWGRRSGAPIVDDVSFDHDAVLAAAGLELAAPLAVRGETGCGWLGLGKKKSGERFGRDDLSLIRTMIGELLPNLDRIRLQEEVFYERASKEKLDELNRAKTEFISTVSHELRTPMSSIRGLAEILQSGTLRSREQTEKFLNLMVSESQRLSRYLHNVLDFGRIEEHLKTYDLRRVVVQDIIRDVVDSFASLADPDAPIFRLCLPESPVVLQADEDALKQALINLIDNAIKYSADDKIVEIGVLDEDGRVEIRVGDHGIGIAPEDKDKIFERFYRTAEAGRKSPGGAGLGLKIVKPIVEAHGGTILVESEVGRGSVFRLVFPKRGNP